MKGLRSMIQVWISNLRRRITTPKWFTKEMDMVRASEQRRDDVRSEMLQFDVDLSKRDW